MNGNKNKRSGHMPREEERRSRILGFTLIGVGSLGLVLTLTFSGLPGFSSVPARFSTLWMQVTLSVGKWFKSSEKEVSPWDLSRVKPVKELKAVPSAKGWSVLDSFYASHPPVEGEAEYYLDPALWREPAKPAATAGGSVPADFSDSLGEETASAPSRRNLGVWTGPADGVQMVDTSIRPAHEQLKRQGAMSVISVPEAGSVSDGVAAVDSMRAEGPAAGDMGVGDAMVNGMAGHGAAGSSSLGDGSGANGSLRVDLITDGSAVGDSAVTAIRPDGTHDAAMAQASAVQTSEKPASSVEKPTSQKSLHVEFWESPVHYKGYQLNGNNLILYGIDESDSLRFENHTDGVWMYHKSAVYRLTTSAELQRFELISGYEEEAGSPAAEEIAD